jgi:hypothetical protein
MLPTWAAPLGSKYTSCAVHGHHICSITRIVANYAAARSIGKYYSWEVVTQCHAPGQLCCRIRQQSPGIRYSDRGNPRRCHETLVDDTLKGSRGQSEDFISC